VVLENENQVCNINTEVECIEISKKKKVNISKTKLCIVITFSGLM